MTMKRFILSLVTFAFVACETELNTNSNRGTLSNISIECISETTISNNASSTTEPFTLHTYLCKGIAEGINGEYSIKVFSDNYMLCDKQYYIKNGEKSSFEFTFTPESLYLDNPINEFIVELRNDKNEILCKTSVVAIKHPKNTTTEPIDVPYMEYTLSGTPCEWSFAVDDNNLIVVNSDEELERYIESESAANFPFVDFTRYTMIIAQGGTPQGIYDTMVESFRKYSDTEYTLNIIVATTMTDAPELWTKALLVDKWDRLYTINLNVDIRELIN